MANIKQHADGSMSIFSDQEQKSLFRVGGSASPAAGGSDQSYRGVYTIKIPLNTSGQGTTAGGSWQNTTGDDLIVGHTYVRVQTAQTATITISVGVGTDSTTLDKDLIDAFAAAGVAANGMFDNITDVGSAGKSRRYLANGSFINIGTSAGGSITSFRGTLYVDVIKA